MTPDRADTDVSLWRRLLSGANVTSIAAGVVTFVLLTQLWDTNRGAIAAAIAGGIVSGVVWLVVWYARRPPPLRRVVGRPMVGAIPEDARSPAPTLAYPESQAAAAFRRAAADLEAHTTGQVVLVTSAGPGQGSTTVALNLAVSATQAGRRVLLVDGDTAGRGLSRYLGTGPSPGLTELATGEASLKEAARLWTVPPSSLMPVVPAGSQAGDAEDVLQGEALAHAIDSVTERADLVLIDSAPILWNGASRPLAAHADGTLLVVNESADSATVARAKERLASAGAPVLGYVVNRSRAVPKVRQRPIMRALKRSVATFALLLVGLALWTSAQVWNSWRSVERDDFDTASADLLLPLPPTQAFVEEELDVPDEVATVVTAPHTPGKPFTTYLIIGSDQIAGAADVILLAGIPNDGSDPFMVSLPRDLYLPNRCTQGYSRINVNLRGCGEEVNGPTLLALAVEDFTGIEVDHFALFDFDGFRNIIDGIGGVQICNEYAVFDQRAQLSLPEGCIQADGDQALGWVRSRHTVHYIDGRWRSLPGDTGDLARNQRQQELILKLLEELKTFNSPGDLTSKVRQLSTFFTLDATLGLSNAITLAWDARSIEIDTIQRLEIPVRLTTNKRGQSILLPTVGFDEVISPVYPHLFPGPGDQASEAFTE